MDLSTLPKDCRCDDETHKGPHWFYEDTLWSTRNKRYLTIGNQAAFVMEEWYRLKEKWQHMKDALVMYPERKAEIMDGADDSAIAEIDAVFNQAHFRG